MMSADPVQSSMDPTDHTSPNENVADEKLGDIENGLQILSSAPVEEKMALVDIQQLSFGQIVNDIWHFMSVDYGHRCVYSNLDVWIRSGLTVGN